MKLSKTLKIKAYKSALQQIIKFYPNYNDGPMFTLAPYVCDLLFDYCYNKNCMAGCRNRDDLIGSQFSEFLECKPRGSGIKWWEQDDLSIILRIQAVEWCIDKLTSK